MQRSADQLHGYRSGYARIVDLPDFTFIAYLVEVPYFPFVHFVPASDLDELEASEPSLMEGSWKTDCSFVPSFEDGNDSIGLIGTL